MKAKLLRIPTSTSLSNLNMTTNQSFGRTFIPSAKIVKPSKYLTAVMSEGIWSYAKNEKGHYMRMTLDGYGSATPPDILQRFFDEMSIKKQKELSKRIEEIQDRFD
jgi:hypothetical protein